MIRENLGIKTIYIMIPVGKKMLIDHVGHKTEKPRSSSSGAFLRLSIPEINGSLQSLLLYEIKNFMRKY